MGQPAKRLSTKEHGGYFRRFLEDGTWARIHDALNFDCRGLEGREQQPTAAIIDSQSAKTGPNALCEVGYYAPLSDALHRLPAMGKKVKGRKRHILVDTVGLLLLLVCCGLAECRRLSYFSPNKYCGQISGTHALRNPREALVTFKLSISALEKAIAHLGKYGDTDVFPHLPELAFFRDESAAIVTELKELDLYSYNPGGAFEALAPKSRFGFRITHQLSAVDTVLFLAAVIEIGSLIEARRPDAKGLEAFSYRFDSTAGGSVFQPNRTFKDWLHEQQNHIQGNLKIKHVVLTDISDFYARINFHRLENLLDEAASANGAARYVKKVIKVIRAKQSFGLPVGGTAARLLAELALSDTDKALIDHGITVTRFVDDFRIFLNAGDNPYDVLSFLAQQLSINEGLSLNAAKTKVMSRAAYLETLKGLTTDLSEEAQGEALETLTADIYFEDSPDPEDIEALQALNLLGFLQEEIGKDDYDAGRVKVIFRALKIAKPTGAIEYIITNFSELVVFAKEVSLLMQALEEEAPGCFNDLTESLIAAILEPPASSVQLIRTWLLELFVRGTVPIAAAQFKQIEELPSLLDKRQLHIIRSRTDNKHFFRMNKAAVGQIPPFEQPAFISGAVCLPKDEYENWLTTLKTVFSGPTCHLFLKWAKSHKEKLIAKLGASVDDHVE